MGWALVKWNGMGGATILYYTMCCMFIYVGTLLTSTGIIGMVWSGLIWSGLFGKERKWSLLTGRVGFGWEIEVRKQRKDSREQAKHVGRLLDINGLDR